MSRPARGRNIKGSPLVGYAIERRKVSPLLRELLATGDCHPAFVGAEPVGYLAIVAAIEDGEVRVFARVNAAFLVSQAKGVRSVDGGGREHFSRRHLHMGASQIEDEWHAYR